VTAFLFYVTPANRVTNMSVSLGKRKTRKSQNSQRKKLARAEPAPDDAAVKRSHASRPPNVTPRAPAPTADTPSEAPERLHAAHLSQGPPVLKFLSRDEVLKMLRVSYGTLFGWIREGNFPPARELNSSERASRIYWLEHEVLEWMANRPPRLPRGTRAIYNSNEPTNA
jgi:predicted DNA-binding transcriptional regulator AlpA